MSTGLSCLFIEPSPGVWWYVLEDGNAPKNAWDWREYSSAYGPFASDDEANEHLCQNHANPGGSETQPYVDGYKPDAVMERLMAEAAERDKHMRAGYRHRYDYRWP